MYHYPVPVAQLIFEMMDSIELFELSRLSRKLEGKIKEAGVRCIKHSVSFSKIPSMRLDFRSENQLEFIFNQPFPRDVKIRTGEIKGLKFFYSAISEKTINVCLEDKSLFGGLYRFYDHFADIFRTTMIGQLDIDVNTIKNVIGLLGIPEFKRCQTLQLIGDKMADEDAKYIQDNCQIYETLSLNGKVGRRDQHYKLYEIKNLIIRQNDWININDLFLMKCENIYIDGANISDLDLINFVKMWKNGESNSHLKTLHVNFTGSSVFDRSQLQYFVPVLPVFHYNPAAPNVPVEREEGSDDSDSSDDEDELAQDQAIKEQRRIAYDNQLHQMEQTLPWKEIGRSLIDYSSHSNIFRRGERNYSQLIGESDIIELDCFYRDVVKFDGTFASIRIHQKSFKMIVWHNFELPP
ncbi:hypothetical protein CRE_20291 [Caenorhabditis remanei]|uniref:F-box domain-containing protein n=1 Tax=Caenorhabditis remanei TaxID=31234 RepID=E3MCK3_CAERE|nr:hypothetical protein CRE_20291 [Caenorhabditis remanei]